jgi:SPP1 family predicted phage head-tail adaptor
MIAAGKLRYRVTIQEATISKSTKGEDVIAWSTYKKRYAEVTPLQGRERYAAQQLDVEVDYRFKIRYTSGVTRDMRILWNNRTFAITAVIPVGERNKEQEIMAKEKR